MLQRQRRRRRRGWPVRTRLVVTSSDWRNHSCCAVRLEPPYVYNHHCHRAIKNNTEQTITVKNEGHAENDPLTYIWILPGDGRAHSGQSDNGRCCHANDSKQALADSLRLLPCILQQSYATPTTHTSPATSHARDTITRLRSLRQWTLFSRLFVRPPRPSYTMLILSRSRSSLCTHFWSKNSIKHRFANFKRCT